MDTNLRVSLHRSFRESIAKLLNIPLSFTKSANSVFFLRETSSNHIYSTRAIRQFSSIRETLVSRCLWRSICKETHLLAYCGFAVDLPLSSSLNNETREIYLYPEFIYRGRGKRAMQLSFRLDAQPITARSRRRVAEQRDLRLGQTCRNCIPQSQGTPPKRDTGIASEKEWGINLENEKGNESGMNEDGSTWYRESAEDLGNNGYRCRWKVMGGCSADGSSEWKETWWEKSDWTGYKELGGEKSGRNAERDSWRETWQEVLWQDEWSNLARIEKNAQKQAKSGNNKASWYEKWWEKYNARGWAEKGFHKYGRLNDWSWWEKWGEQYDGNGAVFKWTDKWAENGMKIKWGDKWEERFFRDGVGTRQGETWHVSANGERWSRTWGEEHFGNVKVHKYGKSTNGESWDVIVEGGTHYETEPLYGWADAIANSPQLLAIKPIERPPGVYPDSEICETPPTQQSPPLPASPQLPPPQAPT